MTKVRDDNRSSHDQSHIHRLVQFGVAPTVVNALDHVVIDAIVAALDAVNNAADPDGLSLYAAMRTETLATDAPGRAMQLVALIREFRGAAHLIALRASGLDTKTAHHIKRVTIIN